MSDPVIPMLRKSLEFFEGKRNAINAVITHLEQTIALVEENAEAAPRLPAHSPAPAAPARKAKLQKIFTRKGPNTSQLSEEAIIDTAIGVIRKNGPQSLSSMTKAIRRIYPKVKGGIGVALRAEEKKTGGRLAREASGRWIEKTTAKRVDDKRSPGEVAAAFAQARANQERQTEAAA